MLISDLLIVGQWWVMFFLLGIINFPISYILFKKFTDLGYGFSKTISMIIPPYAILLLSTSHVAPFTRSVVTAIIFTIIILNIWILNKHKTRLLADIKKQKGFLAIQEILFTFGLFFWSYVRGFQPEIRGLEKFMDYGFINSILNSKYLPPTDMWFAGKPINYYWFGHLVTATLTKLSNIPSEFTYNLMLATILGLTLTSAFSIISTLVKKIYPQNPKKIISAGLISAILLSFAGNFHTPFYILKEGSQKYWYPDATRFIGYNPDVNDKTIHEFPIYSFVVSDLHPHLMNFPFVLLYLALLWRLVNSVKERKIELRNLLLSGFMLGIFFMTSTWDFGNYFLATASVLGFYTLYKHKFKITSVFPVVVWLTVVAVLGFLTAVPFLLNFESIAEGVKLVNSRTPLWQLAILWGFPAVITLAFISTILNSKNKLKKPEIFIFSLLSVSWVLIFLPEIFYVKDIYIASHYRANTMFKLTYQAYVMFYLSSGFIATHTLSSIRESYYKKLASLAFFIIFFSILTYPYFAIRSYYGNLKIYQGLNGISWLQKAYPGEYEAVDFLKNNKNQPTILEAPGDSYTDFNVVSSYTGFPTVSGWFVHEWLWRGDAKFPQERVGDITQIYTSENEALVKSLLKKYNVEFVIVGNFERQKYSNLTEEVFEKIGKVVFSSRRTKIYKIN